MRRPSNEEDSWEWMGVRSLVGMWNWQGREEVLTEKGWKFTGSSNNGPRSKVLGKGCVGSEAPWEWRGELCHQGKSRGFGWDEGEECVFEATFPNFWKFLGSQNKAEGGSEGRVSYRTARFLHTEWRAETPEICSLMILRTRNSGRWGGKTRASSESRGYNWQPQDNKGNFGMNCGNASTNFCFNSPRSTCLLIRILSMTSCTNIWGKALWFSHLNECFARKWSGKEDEFRIMCLLKQKAQLREGSRCTQ